MAAGGRVRVYIEGDAESLVAATGSAQKALARFDKQTSTSTKGLTTYEERVKSSEKSSLSLGEALRKVGDEGSFVDRNIRLIKWPALITGAGAAAQAVSALGAGAVGLTSALAPLSGALAAYPALFGAFAQASGVVALASVDDLTGAVGGLRDKLDETSEEFKKLSPQAQSLARHLQELKAPIRDLQKDVQTPLFKGFDEGIQSARKNLPALNNVLVATSKQMGNLAAEAGRFAGREGFGRDFQAVGKNNAQLLGRLGESGLHFGDALRHISVEAQPLVDFLGKGVVKLSEWVEAEAKAGRESGKLAGFFGETRDVIKQLVDLSGSLGSAFLDIGHAAKPLGEDILAELVDQAERLSDWASSASGQKTLTQYFEDARKPLWEAGRLIGDIVGAFFKLSQTPGLTTLIHQLRTELLPVLVSTLETTTKAFGPHLIDLVTQLGVLFGRMAGSSGPLTLYVDMLTRMAKFINQLFDKFPGLQSAAVAFIGVAGTIKAIKFAGMITGVTKLIDLFKGLRTAAATAAIAEGAAIRGGAGAAGLSLVGGGAAGGAGVAGGALAGGAALAAAPLAVGGLVMLADALQTTDVEKFRDSVEHLDNKLDDLGDESGKTAKQTDGLRSSFEKAAASYREAGDKLAGTINITSKAGAINTQVGKDVINSGKDVVARLKDQYGSLLTAAQKMSKGQRDAFVDFARAAHDAGDITDKQFSHLWDVFVNTKEKVRNMWHDAAAVTGESSKAIARAVGDMRVKVSKDYDGMVTVVGHGLQLLTSNTNKALKALGVNEEISWALESRRSNDPSSPAGQARRKGGYLYSAGGMLPGYSTVDDVPAMLRSGEAVLTPEVHQPIVEGAMQAVYGMGLREMFAQTGAAYAKGGVVDRTGVKHFASGGVAVQQALGPYSIPPIVYDPNHAGGNSHLHLDFFTPTQALATGHKMQGMGWSIGEYTPTRGNPYNFGPITTQHQSPGHYDGTAFDANKGVVEARADVAAIARLLNSGAVTGAGAAVVEKIARVLVAGPDGPLKSMAQKALDRVHSAANAYVSKRAPRATTGADSGLPAASSGALATIARTMVTKAWGATQWPPFLKLKVGESGSTWDPTITNPSSGAGGIPQALPPSKMGAPAWPPTQGKTSAIAQIDWMIDYIRSVYGTPAGAYGTWLSRSPHWYRKGGFAGRVRRFGRGGGLKPGGGMKPPSTHFVPGDVGWWNSPLAQTNKPPTYAPAPSAYTPGPSSDELALAELDVAGASAEATLGVDDDRAVLDKRAAIIQKQIRRVSNELAKKGLSRKKRLALLQQLASLKGELNSIASSQQGLYDNPDFTGGDQTPTDTSAADQAAALQANTDALKAVQDELKRQNDLIVNTTNSDLTQALAFIGGLLSGEIGGLVQPRLSTAGSGSVYRA